MNLIIFHKKNIVPDFDYRSNIYLFIIQAK